MRRFDQAAPGDALEDAFTNTLHADAGQLARWRGRTQPFEGSIRQRFSKIDTSVDVDAGVPAIRNDWG